MKDVRLHSWGPVVVGAEFFASHNRMHRFCVSFGLFLPNTYISRRESAYIFFIPRRFKRDKNFLGTKHRARHAIIDFHELSTYAATNYLQQLNVTTSCHISLRHTPSAHIRVGYYIAGIL
jgi:hypothetical protein